MTDYLVLILSKDKSKKTNTLCEKLENENISYKNICDSCTIDSDEIIKNLGFTGLTRSPYIKRPSAWDKAFHFVQNNNLTASYKYFFFIEDDVYSKNYTSLLKFIIDANIFTVDLITKQIRPKSHHPKWKHWQENYVNELKAPHQSFNPLCRLSSKLITKIIEYKNYHGTFEFHEILIASLCLENNFSYINYVESSILKKYIGQFRYNPILTVEDLLDDLIYHPVKPSKDEREKSIVLP